MEPPVALQPGATNTVTELLLNVVPCRPAMPLHVIVGDLIRDALVAQTRHEPIKHGRGVAGLIAARTFSARRSARISSSKVGDPARPQTAWISRTAWLIAEPWAF